MKLTRALLLGLAVLCLDCGTSSEVGPTQSPVPTGSERYVTIGFWTDPTCTGAPVSTNRFPVHDGDTQCYSWPGRSGANSASRFACGAGRFSYTQWTTLTCSGGQNPAGYAQAGHPDRLYPGCPADAPCPHCRFQRLRGKPVIARHGELGFPLSGHT